MSAHDSEARFAIADLTDRVGRLEALTLRMEKDISLRPLPPCIPEPEPMRYALEPDYPRHRWYVLDGGERIAECITEEEAERITCALNNIPQPVSTVRNTEVWR